MSQVVMALSDAKLREKVKMYQEHKRQEIEHDDKEVMQNG